PPGIDQQHFLLPVVRNPWGADYRQGAGGGAPHLLEVGGQGQAAEQFNEGNHPKGDNQPAHRCCPALSPSSGGSVSSRFLPLPLVFFSSRLRGYQKMANRARNREASTPRMAARVPAPRPGPI